ncbi:MAG: ABC transporter substrate-binding protein [Opitutaceae bacterium]
MLLQAAPDDTVVLRLKWWHQFQFAGFYAAQAMGYYQEEGVNVRIEEGKASQDSIDAVVTGQVQFGISDSSLVLRRIQGAPVVACAAILQHAPDVIMSRQDRNIRTPADLVGTKIMLRGEQGLCLLTAMLRKEGIAPDAVVIVPHTWRLNDLIEGRVDAMTAYATEEPIQMRRRGVEPSLMRSLDYGVDFYGDTLFTNEQETRAHPERTAAFIRASLRGWDYALKNPQEIADLILKMDGVKARGVTRESLLGEAEAMTPYILSDVVEIGHMNPGRWDKIAQTFIDVGMAPKGASLDGFIFDPHADRYAQLTRWALRLGAVAAAVSGMILLWNLQMRRRVTQRTRELAEEIAQRSRAEEGLRASEERFRLMFTGAATGIAVISPEGRFLQANPSYCNTTGYSEEELQGLTLGELIYPEQHPAYHALMDRLLKGPEDNFTTEIRCLKKDGGFVWKRASVSMVRPTGEKPGSIIIVAEDVSARHTAEEELARVNRAQHMLGDCNEALIRSDSEAQLLAEICRIAVVIGGYRMAWVGFAQHDEAKSIRPVAHAGEEQAYLSEISLSWREDTPTGRGPVGRSIREGRATFCTDIETDNRFTQWRSAARNRGYRSMVCLPLKDEYLTYGMLGLYSGDVLSIGQDEIKLLQQLADDLAFGIRTLRARAERQKTQEAVIKVARGVSASIGAEFFSQLTHNMVAALGADIGVIAMLAPATPAQAHTLCVVADGVRQNNFSYTLQGAPCEKLSPGHPYIVAQDVQRHFPASALMSDLGAQAYVGHPLVTPDGRLVGVMAVLFRRPLEQTDFIASSLQIFATRAASELDRQQTDSRLQEQAALLDKAQDAIIVRGLEHHITYWNKSAERLYGWTAQEVLGRSIASLLYKEPSGFLDATRQVISKGEWVGELHQVNKDGTVLIVECRWTLVRDENDTPRSVLAINTDITEKKKLEHQFLRAQRMESIGTLAGGIAHDLNNVLTPIIMAVDLMTLNETDANKIRLLDSIATSARRGADMVGQVLSFARGMDGRRIEVRIVHLVQDIEKMVQESFPKSIGITTRITPDIWPITGDPTQLHQVLINLCVNARDAMPEGGQLTLTAENVRLDDCYAAMNIEAKAGPHVVLQIEDTGQGIPEAIIDKVFDPFFTTKEVGKGTGLGLSTTLAIVKSHGGFIHIYSEEKKGTRFRIYLPAQPAAIPAAPTAEDPVIALPRGHGETVLVIDDEAAIREVARHTLEAFGYRVLEATDGAAGAATYAGHRTEIGVVLIDMMMPVMDGPAAIAVLTKMNPSVRIVAASGIAANAGVARAASRCVKAFLSKPYTAESLLKTLRSVIDAPAD